MEINNISTYATWTSMVVLLLQVICRYFNIPIGESDLTIIANTIVTLIIALWSSYNPNTIKWLGNATTPTPESPILNDEYVTGDDIDDLQ